MEDFNPDDPEAWFSSLRGSPKEVARAVDVRIAEENDPEVIKVLHGLLIERYVLNNCIKEAAEAHEARLSIYPRDVVTLTGAARFYFSAVGDVERGFALIGEAITLARQTLMFRRMALGEKARFALDSGRYDLFVEAVVEIIRVNLDVPAPDVSFEDDFIQRAPPEALPTGLRSRFFESMGRKVP